MIDSPLHATIVRRRGVVIEVGVLRLGERVDDPVAEVLLGAAGLRLRHLRGFDALQLTLDLLRGKIARHALAQVAQARQQGWHAGIAMRRHGSCFP